MTYPGAPLIYYGDEVGMEGGRDPDCRRAFLWQDGSEEPHPSWDLELRDHFKACIALRRRYAALRRGDFVSLCAEGGVYVYLRSLKGEKLIVVINNQAEAYDLNIPVGETVEAGSRTEAVLGKGQAVVRDGRLVGSRVPAYTGVVFSRV